MTTIERAEVVDRINDLRQEVRDDIREIKDLIEKLGDDVNTRVSRLELWKARSEGARAAFAWVPALVTGAIGSGVGAIVALLIAH